MYNSQYYTCEQIDERLLQGYLDDYNTQTGQSLTKAQFLTKLGSIFSKEGVIDNTATQIGYYECDTAAGTAAKAITVANYALFAGGSMKVKFANKNTANNATLNINSQGAKALYYQGERASATNSWDAEEVVEIYYDGTSYYANNVKGGSGYGVYDVSKEHPTSGPNSDGKFTLEYILNSSNVNELIPVNKRYPGMSIQFVSTSDNKYVRYDLLADSFTADVTQWAIVNEGVYVENPEFIIVLLDGNKRILWGIQKNGNTYYGAGVPQQVIDYIQDKIAEYSLEEIVSFLNGLETGDKPLDVLLDEKVDKEIGKSLINADYAGSISYINNPEFLSVLLDYDGKIVFGFRKDGDILFGCGVPSQIVDYVTKKIAELNNDITAINEFLAGISSTTLLEYLNNTYGEYIDNPEFMSVELDADGKILGGRKKDGTKFENCDVDINGTLVKTIDDKENRLEITTDIQGRIISYRRENGTLVENAGVETPFVRAQELNLSENGLNKLKEDLDITEPSPAIATVDDTIEIADGKQRSYGTYQSELEASPFINKESDYNVKYKTISKDHTIKSINKKFVVMNHDDGELSDILCNRKIYNKYGFTGNSCIIFREFSSLADAKLRIENGRKFLNEGHAAGLHAIMRESYWYANRVYDVKPDGSSNFAPLLSEIRGNNADGTGTNAFGQTITADTLASEVYYMSTSASVIPELNVKVVELTQEQVNRLNRQYCLYTDEWTSNGIDDLALDDLMKAESADIINKSRIGWVEYYYNGLVDNTLGYSSTAASIAAKFAEDYSVPSGASISDYYPDVAHLKNGKMVYWNDLSNAHYAEAKVKTTSGFSANDYQLVGKFTKGLYKDCFSTMNFEVMDRCVAAAEAFFRKYYGLNHFTEFHIHGIQYLNFYYTNEDGSIYADRDKQMIYYPTAKWYSSRIGAFKSVSEIMADFGMSMMKDGLRRQFVNWQGSYGFYYKADGIRNEEDDFHNGSKDTFGYNDTNYLNTFGVTDEGGKENMDYNTFMQFLEGIDDWTKFVYERGGESVTRNGLTMKIYKHLRTCINKCMGSVGTGAVPVISVDTLRNNPAMALAVELLFRFLKANGFEVHNFEEGKKKLLSERRNTCGNLFPNPSFEQSTLRYFGGSSTSKYAYVPDGWMMSIQGSSSSVSLAVAKETVDNNTIPVFSIGGYIVIQTSMWGLPAGSYKLSYWSKGNNASIVTKVCKNSDLIDDDTNVVDTFNPTSEWAEHMVDITIPEFHRNAVDGSDFYNVVCDGYEDNVCCILVRIVTTSNSSTIKIASPKLLV